MKPRIFTASISRGLGNDLTGNNDILNLTVPDAIRDIHISYLEAGADIIATNTFNATTISQADYGMEDYVDVINVEGARLAQLACEDVMARVTRQGLLGSWCHWPDQPDDFDFARCQRSGFSCDRF